MCEPCSTAITTLAQSTRSTYVRCQRAGVHTKCEDKRATSLLISFFSCTSKSGSIGTRRRSQAGLAHTAHGVCRDQFSPHGCRRRHSDSFLAPPTKYQMDGRVLRENTNGSWQQCNISSQSVNPIECKGNYSATSYNTKLVHWPLMGGLLHLVHPSLYQCIAAHQSAASVPITVLLYNGPLLCGFNVPIKGLTLYSALASSIIIDHRCTDLSDVAKNATNVIFTIWPQRTAER